MSIGLSEWISLGKESGASDLHLEAGSQPLFRVRGELVPMGEPVSGQALLEVAQSILGTQRWQEFLERRSADLSETICGTRCRINVFNTVRGVSFAVRLLSSFQNNIRDCNLHPEVLRFTTPDTGLVIISGATGSGKSTTLAALIEEINRARRRHIITIENPIEYFFKNRKSFIRQREVQSHTPSFEQAITDSLREDPDVLVIGEMRTPDVMRLTLNAAETGHLVLATMHSSTSAEALARFCMSFAPEIQPAIRSQLADALVGVICQKLIYLSDFNLQVPQCEILMANSGVKALIRQGQFSKIISSIQTGAEDGMWSSERYQRWIDEKHDWVTEGEPLKEEVETSFIDETLNFQPSKKKLSKPAAAAVRSVSKSSPKPIEPSRAIKSLSLEEPTGHSSETSPKAYDETYDGGRIEITDPQEDLEVLVSKIADQTSDEE